MVQLGGVFQYSTEIAEGLPKMPERWTQHLGLLGRVLFRLNNGG